MKQLLLYVSTDPYSHNLKLYKQLNEYGGNTEQDLKEYANAVKHEFTKGSFSAIHILMMDIKVEEGSVEIVVNEYGKHPLKTRLEINPKAAEKQKTKASLTANAMFPPFPQGAVINDWLNQAPE